MAGKAPLRRRLTGAAACGGLLLTGALLAGGPSAQGSRFADDSDRVARAALMTAEGDRVGHVRFEERWWDGGVRVQVRARDLPAGIHGFHVHMTGSCEPPSFTSAGGHLNLDGTDHPDHSGDMPTLLVTQDGDARASFATDRFSLDDLRDADGSAVIVHELPDNHANIPDRYASAPDEDTLDTGDAGGRIACGEVE